MTDCRVINGLFRTFQTKGGELEKKRTNNNIWYVSALSNSRKENCKTSHRSLRPAGGLTYCISAGWERTSNLTLLLPGSGARRTGNNSFSDCWSRQCPWYWKPTALGVSNLQSKELENNFNSLDLIVHSEQLGLMAELYGALHIYCTCNVFFFKSTVTSRVTQESLYKAEQFF